MDSGVFIKASFILLFITMLAGAPVCFGDAVSNSSEAPLTLSEALRLADRNNLQLDSARQEAAAAGGQVMQARSVLFPQLNINARYVRLDEAPTMIMDDMVIPMGQLDNYEVTAELSQLIYAGGGAFAARRLAKEYQDGVLAGVEDARQKTLYAVHALFNGVLLARQQLQVADEAMQHAEQTLQDVTQLYRQGIATKFDQLRAESRVSRSRADRIAAQNGLNLARLELLSLLNLPMDDPRDIAGTLEYTPKDPETVDALELAMAHRPDLASARAILAARSEAVTIARSGYRPTLAAFGQYQYSNPDRMSQNTWEDTWVVGLQAKIPVFRGGETRGKVVEEQARERQAELQLQSVISQVKLDIARAESDVRAARHLVDAYDQSVREADEALRLVNRAYEQGLQPQIDVITAQVALTDAQMRHAAAVYQHTMALRAWELAVGILSVNPVQPVMNTIKAGD